MVDTERWRTTVELGALLQRLREVRGSVVRRADVAMVVDYEAWWACGLGDHPSRAVGYLDVARDLYNALWHRGVAVDFVGPADPLDDYRLVIVPTL